MTTLPAVRHELDTMGSPIIEALQPGESVRLIWDDESLFELRHNLCPRHKRVFERFNEACKRC